MTYFEFDDSLKVGNKIIDQEHAILIEFINLLEDSSRGNASRQMLARVLDGLIEYANTHFYVEEEFMRAFDYPDQEDHMAAHQAFRDKIRHLKAAFDTGAADTPHDVLAYLKDWLTSHILRIDRKLAGFLRDKPL